MENLLVYHYTALDTFVNIVKSDSFKLFDIIKSNDPLEGVFSITELKKAYLDLYKNDDIT